MEIPDSNAYLLKAIRAFGKKILVISDKFIIIAASGHDFSQRDDAQITGNRCHAVLFDRAAPCADCPVPEVQATRKPAYKRLENGSEDPDKVSCLYAYPILQDDAIDAFVVLDCEFPALKGLEDKLQRTNSFLRNLINSSVDAVIAAGTKGEIIFFNDAAAEVSGYTVSEALNSLNIRSVYPGDGARDVMRKLRNDDYGGRGKLKSYQVDFLRKDGEIIPISLNAAIVYEDDREVATIGFFHDLRETIKIKAELEKTQIQLLQAEKMASLGKLAAGVAHQLNNPLGGITLYAQLMMEEYDLAQDAREDMGRIIKDTQRCRDIVKELLQFARQTRQDVRPHDLNQAISRTLFLIENQTLFQNIVIEKRLAPALPPVPGDIQQLSHVFMNVILNAAEAMDGQGKITVATELMPTRDRVAVEITDTGPGIPDDVLPHVFEPFFTTKEEGKGTGLGLSVAYGIVNNHGGNILVRNQPEAGAAFLIELPLARGGKGDDTGARQR